MILITLGLCGVGAAWWMTVPLHRFKELRPLTPRDVATEGGTATTAPVAISAVYRQAICSGCHHVCSTSDAVPVLSWFRGCPACGKRFPWTVPLIQIGVPVALLLTLIQLNGSLVALPYLWLVLVLAAIAIVDLRIWLIPYWMPWLGASVGLAMISVVSVALGDPLRILFALGGGAGAFLLFFVLWLIAPSKLGFGDVRMALLLGMFLAWLHPLLPIYGLLFGSLFGLLMGIAALVIRKDSRFPFGPGLAVGAMCAIWFHEALLQTVF
ncbi:MAG: A24 family peptidase [Microthrixaceae bacterium]